MSNVWHLKCHFEISVSTKHFGIVEDFLPHTWNPHQAIMLGSVDTINDPKYHRSLKLTGIKIWKMFLWLLSSDSRTLTLTHSHSHTKTLLIHYLSLFNSVTFSYLQHFILFIFSLWPTLRIITSQDYQTKNN